MAFPLLFAVILVVMPASDERSERGSAPQQMPLEAKQLVEIYSANQAKGDLTFTGKVITVRGTVERVRRETNGTRYGVEILGVPRGGVICFFSGPKAVADLNPKDKVTIKGKTIGLIQVKNGVAVALSDCELIKRP